MEKRSWVSRRWSAACTVAAMVAAGLVGGLGGIPAASADPGPMAGRTAALVTSDSLPTVQVDGVVWSQVIVGNTVYVGGKFTNARPAGAAAGVNTTARSNMLAYDITTGALIQGFAPSVNGQVQNMSLSPDKKRLYVVGDFTTINGVNKARVAAFDTATGALIQNFNAGVDYKPKAVVATDTTVYVGGMFNKSGSTARSKLAAFSASNGALTTWNPGADSTVSALVLTSDNSKLIVGGMFQNIGGQAQYGLAALDPATGAVMPWNANKTVMNAGANAGITSLRTDGKRVYGTAFHYGPGGNLEGTFGADPTTGDVQWLEDCHGDSYDNLPMNGIVYVVSHAHYCGNIGGFPQSEPNWLINTRRAMAFTDQVTGTINGPDPHGYYNWGGTPSPSIINWFPELAPGTVTGQAQAAWTITGNGQYVIMGGEFPSVNGVGQQGLARFAVEPTAPGKMGPKATAGSMRPTLVNRASGGVKVGWQANWDMDDLTLNYKVYRNNGTTPVYQVSNDNAFWNRPTLGFIDTSVSPGTTYSYKVVVTDSDGNSVTGSSASIAVPAAGSDNQYAKTLETDGASLYWPLNETSGSVSVDNIGFNDGDQGSGVGHGVSGPLANIPASSFDGTTNGVSSTRQPVTAPDTFSVETWFNTTSTSGGKIVGFGNSPTGTSGSYDRHVYMTNDGKLVFGVYPGGVRTVTSANSYNDGQWHQVVASLGSSGMVLYVDGKKVGSRSDTTSGQPYSGYWRLGGDNIGGWPGQPSSNFLAGSIGQFSVYPTQLSGSQVNNHWVAAGRSSALPTAPTDAYGAAVYGADPSMYLRLNDGQGQTAVDSSPSSTDATVQGGVTFGQAGALQGVDNKAAAFNGSDGFIASGTTYDNPMNYSEEAWIKTTTTNGGKIIGFGNSNQGTSGNYDRHVYMEPSGRVSYGVWTGQANIITSPNSLNDGSWHHLVATQSSTDGMKFYVDGQLVGTNPQTQAQGYGGYWRVGGDSSWSGSPFFAGTIDEPAVYSSVLTADQVAGHYNSGNGVRPNVPPTSAFTAAATDLSVTFDGSSSSDSDGQIASYAWDFGDNGTSSAAKPVHTYQNAGDYQVKLTVTDDKGATATSSKTVTVTAPNQPPTAAFAAQATNLSVAFDGSGSTDADGSVTAYSWDFGDQTPAGSGATVTHDYSQAGTYAVKLTVTDNRGATGTTTSNVTVSGVPAPTVYAADAFQRSVSGGWGSADQGGPWTIVGGAANASVNGSVGVLSPQTAGSTVAAALTGVSSADVDESFSFAIDKPVTGGGTYVQTSVRKVGTTEYRLKTIVTSTGKVNLVIERLVSGAATTLKSMTVNGLTYSQGSTVNLRFQAIGTGSTTLNAKAWAAGSAEPAGWSATATDDTAALQRPGGLQLSAYLSGTSTNAPIAVSLDNLQVTAPRA